MLGLATACSATRASIGSGVLSLRKQEDGQAQISDPPAITLPQCGLSPLELCPLWQGGCLSRTSALQHHLPLSSGHKTSEDHISSASMPDLSPRPQEGEDLEKLGEAALAQGS